MSLQNLARIGQLVEHETDASQVGKLIEAAVRLREKLRSWLGDNRPDLLAA